MPRTPIFGGFYVAQSLNLAENRCINLYPEFVETKDGKDIGALFLTPGLTLYRTIGSGPIWGMHLVAKTNTVYVISGSNLYTLDGTLVGAVAASEPVSMLDQADQQLAIFGDMPYLLNIPSNVLSPLTMPFPLPLDGTRRVTPISIDGFGFINRPGTYEIYQSNLLDLSVWNPLTFGSASGETDIIDSLSAIHRELYVHKQYSTEVWVNANQPNFTMQRLDGVFLEVGVVAHNSIARVGESLIFLSQSLQGQGIVIQLNGYKPERISTHAIEYALSQYSTITDAIAYSYQQRGHVFYVLTFPAGDATWVYDATTRLWHKRSTFTSDTFFHRQNLNCCVAYNGDILVGDSRSGNIYILNPDMLTDNGMRRKWLRTWRAYAKPQEEPMEFSSLRIDMQTGLNVPVGTNPQCMLRWSDDGGHTWSNERQGAVGQTGQTGYRVKFNRLGSTRRNSGLDRVFELSASDAFPVAIVGAVLDDET